MRHTDKTPEANRIYQGDCREILYQLPEKSVDLIFADPPYNLQLQNTLLRPNLTEVDAVDDAWDQFDDFASYDQFTREWLTACRHVLKDTGTLWVIGSYHNIYRVGSILQDLGYWFLNDVVWVKCLAGSTELFGLINGQPIVSTLKDLVRINLTDNRIQLPSYNEYGCPDWVDVTAWGRTEKSRGLYIEFEDGTWVECSLSHRFPTLRQGKIEMVAAENLQAQDTLLQLGQFELSHVVFSKGIDAGLGEFIGWYLAEGSFQAAGKGIQLSLSADEQPHAQRLLDLIRDRFGVVGRTHCYDTCLHLIFPGHFMVELVQRFVRGDSSHTKRLAREAFFHGVDFLEGILYGYLQGDAYWEEKAHRWRLGLCNNRGLVTDLAVISRITQHRIRFSNVNMPYQRAVAEAIRGEIRHNADDRYSYISLADVGLPARSHFALGQRYSVSSIRDKYKWSTRKSGVSGEMPDLARQVIYGNLRPVRIKNIRVGTQRVFYDISVTGNHIFALANGLLTHNSNPMPNFRGVRFTNAHETLLWCKKSKEQKRYTFNYHAMRMANDEKQMRSDWELALCTGSERLMVNGEKLHTTQKPEALLYRVILASSNPGDVVLDPFFGTGTTGAVARKLGRHFIGIEREEKYIRAAQKRIDAIAAPLFADDEVYGKIETKRSAPRIPFTALLENGLLLPGQTLYFNHHREKTATVLADGSLRAPDGERGSIHKIGAHIGNLPACNGWEHWYYETEQGELVVIANLREQCRKLRAAPQGEAASFSNLVS